MEKTVTIKCRDMIEALGLNNLPLEEKDSLVSQMSDIVSSKIILKVMETISGEEANELNGYLESGLMGKVDSFLNQKVPNFSSIIQTELNNLQEEMLKKIGA
ncbi:MAG: hypothetical protein WC938_02745 [Candidatus Paceibacterota bacterium]|jgi:hypothetical protein